MTTFAMFPQNDYDHSADDVGAALGGFIRRDSNGLPVPGILGSRDELVAAVPAAWQVRVRPFVYVGVTGAIAQFSGVSADEIVDITPAAGSVPSGQARIDRIVWDPVSAEVGVVEGTPAANPGNPPSGGAVTLGTVRVNAGDGMVVPSRVQQHAVVTSLLSNEPAIARGRITKRSVSPGAVVRVNVSFPAGRFTSAPDVQVSKWGDARDANVAFDNVTASGMRVQLESMSTVRRSIGAHWRASQGE